MKRTIRFLHTMRKGKSEEEVESVYHMALDLIKQHEGLRLKPYMDTTNHLSIGYGRNLTDNGIGMDEADMMLKNDLHKTIVELNSISPFSTLDPVRQVVLIDMCYNLGLKRLLKFVKMWTAIRLGKYDIAANEMLDSLWSKQVGARSHRLAEMMRRGTGR